MDLSGLNKPENIIIKIQKEGFPDPFEWIKNNGTTSFRKREGFEERRYYVQIEKDSCGIFRGCYIFKWIEEE